MLIALKMIFITTFFNNKSQWKTSIFDYLCGFLSFCGVVLWIITRDGNTAIIFSIIANTMAGVPTVIKAYKSPQTEASWPWLATVVGMALTLFTLDEWTLSNAGFIFSILLTSGIIFLLVQRKR